MVRSFWFCPPNMDVCEHCVPMTPQEWAEQEQRGQRGTEQYFRTLGNLLADFLWGKKSLDSQFTWTLNEAKFKHHIVTLTDRLLDNNPVHRLHFCELMLNCMILRSHSHGYAEFYPLGYKRVYSTKSNNISEEHDYKSTEAILTRFTSSKMALLPTMIFLYVYVYVSQQDHHT
jgi:hypothetical protein